MSCNEIPPTADDLKRQLDTLEQQLPRREDCRYTAADAAAADRITTSLTALFSPVTRAANDGHQHLRNQYQSISTAASHIRTTYNLLAARQEAHTRQERSTHELADVDDTLGRLTRRREELLVLHAAADDVFTANDIRRQGFQVMRETAAARRRRLELLEQLRRIPPADSFAEELEIDKLVQRADAGLRECGRSQMRRAS